MRAPIVFPIRVAAGPAVVQTTTREVSADGVFVCSLRPPKRGMQVSLKLYLTGGQQAEEAAAVVGPPTPIVAMSLAQKPLDDPRRAFPRVEARFGVRFGNVQDFVLEYAANISAGGVFVQTESPPELHAVVAVTMELPDGGKSVEAKGVVVHRVSAQDAKARNTPPGAGVQFVDSSDEFRERIDRAIEFILKRS